MSTTFFGSKKQMSEAFLGETRVAVTKIELYPMKVAAVKDGKTQVVFGPTKKHPSKAIVGHLKASGVTSGYIREIPMSEGETAGMTVAFADTLKPGTVINIQGTTKGKGFAGVVKRWGFAGGPKTHGQSDRHRAPGSIGQGTTPGRVHRGKKMAGHMGTDTQVIKNLTVVAVVGNYVWVTGPVPGAAGSLVKLMVTAQKDTPELTYLKGYNPKKEESVAEIPVEPAVAPEVETQTEEKVS